LPEFSQCRLVDVDDAHRRIFMVGARLQALVAVEGKITQPDQLTGIDRAQQQGVDQHQQRDDPGRSPVVVAQEPSHAHSLPRPSGKLTLRTECA
jgi:hypothetical protein